MRGICEGRVVIVTGAGGGIGRCHALEFAKQGAKVVVNDLGVTNDGQGGGSGPADAVVDEIKAAGGEAVANFANVADWKQSDELVQQAYDAYGKLDVLLNNAGIIAAGSILDVSTEDFDRVLAVNLRGTFLACRFVIPGMLEQGSGSIIIVASVEGIEGFEGGSGFGEVLAGGGDAQVDPEEAA